MLEEAIGVGGMGAVFRAHDSRLDRQVALKLLPPDQTGDPEIVQRFYQEGKSAAQLDHENIARVYSIGQDGHYHYIAFEYIEGMTVRRRVDESGPLPIGEAMDITLQIGQALVHAAGRSVVHRDIKPSNIILTPQGRAKLVDMGLARRFEREGDLGLTQTGMTLGTFDYISPEQARDPRDVDVRSDLYSLGCTLFHMLGGTPPFPGGTVLQKLLQHQEEAPPDIRALNPGVPTELARILNKLMAKDRDRRYQSPEQLVRDILVVAGKLGIPLSHAEPHVWGAPGHRQSWEHHLVWLLPAMAFFLVVGALVWWGREFANPNPSASVFDNNRVTRLEPGVGPNSLRYSNPPLVILPEPEPTVGPATPATGLPRNYSVTPGEDLLAIIATAAPRSTVTLTEDGNYLLGSRMGGTRVAATQIDRDLVIKAEAGKIPVLRFATDALGVDRASSALLSFEGGHITIDGLVFDVGDVPPGQPVSAVQVAGTELSIRGCSFRQSGAATTRDVAALLIRKPRKPVQGDDRPPAVSVDRSHFDGGQVAVLAEGPTDLQLRDCTMGPSVPSIWLRGSRSDGLIPIDLRMRHCSLMTGPGPVFRSEGAQARIWADDCVMAPPTASSAALLVAVDDLRNLKWLGRSNLYARFQPFLTTLGGIEGGEIVEDFLHWKETSSEEREVGTQVAMSPVWDSADPIQNLELDRENPTRAFQLASSHTRESEYGARRGPFGSELVTRQSSERLAARLANAPGTVPTGSEGRPPEPPPMQLSPSVSATDPIEIATATGVTNPPATAQRGIESVRPATMPPMVTAPVTPATVPSVVRRSPSDPSPTPNATTNADASSGRPAESLVQGNPGRKESLEEDPIRSAEQFATTLNRLGEKGGTLRIAAGVDLELSPTDFQGSVNWSIEAERGGRRPRLRFRPSLVLPKSPTAWSVLFNLRAGTLQLQGLDLLIQDTDMTRATRLAAIGVNQGTELVLNQCTVTIAGAAPGSSIIPVMAAIVVQNSPTRAVSDADTRAVKPAIVRVRDGFLRSAGDCLTVASNQLLDLDIRNSIVGTEASLLHAQGNSRSSRPPGLLKLRIDRVLTWSRGGLVHLESTIENPELSLTEVVAANSIISTAGTRTALFRVDGQDQMEKRRDLIRWNAERVAYHEIVTYRRDQVAQLGAIPTNYDRTEWTTAFDPKDDQPVLGDLKFLRKLEPEQSSWEVTKDDFRLAPRSPVADRGPDMGQIPDPPAADS